MAKVTSKYQVTVPKVIADRYGIHPGDDIDWVAAGDVILVIPAGKQGALEDKDTRLRWFDQATERHREISASSKTKPQRFRGWKRQDLYNRGRTR